MNFSSSSLNRRRFMQAGLVAGVGIVAAPSLTATGASASTTTVGRVVTAEQAAQRVLAMATESVQLGSKGVGGLIMDNRTGKVIRESRNYRALPVSAAVATGPNQVFTWDYTAHGETGLVGWYQFYRKKLGLPDPQDLTIVTSLDPCAMCTGSIFTAGFNAAVVAFDPSGGMNVTADGRYKTLTPNLRDDAFDTLGFYAVEGVREYFGPQQIPLRSTAVSAETAHACESVFFSPRTSTSLDDEVPINDVIDPRTLPATDPFRVALQEKWPMAFSIRLSSPTSPSKELKEYLERLNKATPGSTNAVAFIDLFGNLITAVADRPSRSIATAFMNTTQSYAQGRYELFNDPATHEGAKLHLAGPRFGSFIWLHAPTPDIPSTLKDLGAFGSTMGGPAPGGFQFYLPPLRGTFPKLLEQIAYLPPFYTQQVGINPLPVGVFSPMPT
jgi:tRNA(Arg) A34 adenosine deaminase TadA